MKRFFCKVSAAAKKEYLEKLDENHLKIAVKETPQRGRANQAVIKLLSEYLKIPADRIKIVRGFNTRQKIIIIND